MKLIFQFALTILLTILILNSCEKENPDVISNNDSSKNITLYSYLLLKHYICIIRC